MLGKKQKKHDEEGMGGLWSALFTSLVLGPLFSRIQDFFVNLFASAQEAAEGYVRRVVQGLVVAVAALVGGVFVLIGLAQCLSQLYGRAGAGELIVGGALLLLALVWYLIPGKRR